MNIQTEGDRITIKLDTDLSATVADQFKKEFRELLETKPKEVIVDFMETRNIDSVGIGVIVAGFNTLNKSGGEVRLINVDENIYKIFTTMRLDRHLSISPR